MAARLDVDLIPSRTVAVRTQQQQLVEIELASRAAAAGPPAVSNWADLGVFIGASPPASPITYASWAGGTPGYWAWIQV